MTPGTFNIPIFKGAKWEFTFLFKVTGTSTPIDLTNLGPFVATLRNPKTRVILAQGTVTSAYDATGLVTVKFTAAQTINIPLGSVSFGVRDAVNNPYIQADIPVKFFAPEPT